MEIQSIHNPTFTGYKSSFSKKLEKTLSTPKMSREKADALLKNFADMYDKKVCQDSKIGAGFYGSVYKIDDCYVLKRGNEYLKPEFSRIKPIKKQKFSHLKHYFGEAVAKIYNKVGEDMFILKNVYSKGKSIAVGIPNEFAKKNTHDECIKYYSENYLPKFAKLPQRSFDGIAKDFALLNKMCTKRKSYTFDYINPNNFVLCGKTLRIIDEINETDIRTSNCVTDMLEVFLNKMDLDLEAIYDESLVPLRKELAKKLILAGARHKIPMCQSQTDLNSWGKTFNDLLRMEISLEGMEYIVKIIDNIVEKNNNPKKRVELVKKYLEDVIGL